VTVVRFVIALMLDASSAATVRGLGRSLRPAGGESGVEPHVTLAACSGLDVDLFRPEAAELAARTQPLGCTLASVGVFPTAEGVLFLAPTISPVLVQLQLVVLDRLQLAGGEIEPYWMPGAWVAHCTLATGIPREAIAAAVAQTLDGFQPFAGTLVRLGVFAIDPSRLCYEFPLGRQ
jgi:hypothetical protein